MNGCCLTLTSCRSDRLTFDLLEETIARTNLHDLRQGSPVNLERALRADGRIGGHFVQGHVDCVAPIIAFDAKGADFRLEVELPENTRTLRGFQGLDRCQWNQSYRCRSSPEELHCLDHSATPNVTPILIVRSSAIL